MASVVATFTLSRASTSGFCLTADDSQPQGATPTLDETCLESALLADPSRNIEASAYFLHAPFARRAASLFRGSNKQGCLLLTIHLARSEFT